MDHAITFQFPQPKVRDDKEAFFECDWFAKRYPNLFMFLAAPEAYGKPREAGSFKLFAKDGRLKVCFSEPSVRMSGFATLEVKADLYGELETLLAEGRVDWREWSDQNGGNKKK